MKRIVLCFDGTWNKPADDAIPAYLQIETNVRRFYESVAPRADNDVKQITWYDAGVGTEWYNELTGGAFGALLDRHILDGYRYLVDHYEDGDEIYIVGFSRGAYTARSLVGMLRNCGLVDSAYAGFKVATAYGIYRTRQDHVDSPTAVAFRKLFSREVKIKFLGVWDTVGSLGIPLKIASKVNTDLYGFHDTQLSGIVEHAYQAVAIDEHREDYNACLWTPSAKPAQTLEQRWFSGAHCDVGGGYPDRRLSDITLRWMQEKAAALGLKQTKTTVAPDNYLGETTDSYARFLKGVYAQHKERHLRALLSSQYGNERLDESVKLRCDSTTFNPRYSPKNKGFQ